MGDRQIGLTARSRWASGLLRKVKNYVDARTIAPDVPGWQRTPQGMVPIGHRRGQSSGGTRRRPFEVYRGVDTLGQPKLFMHPGVIACWNTGSGANGGVPGWVTPTIAGFALSDTSDGGLLLLDGTNTVYFDFTLSQTTNELQQSYSSNGETDDVTVYLVRHSVSSIDIDQDGTMPSNTVASSNPDVGVSKTYLEVATYTYDSDTDDFTVDTQYADGNFSYVIGDQLYDGTS